MCNQPKISIKDIIIKSRLMSRTSTKPRSTYQKYRWLLKENRKISPQNAILPLSKVDKTPPTKIQLPKGQLKGF